MPNCGRPLGDSTPRPNRDLPAPRGCSVRRSVRTFWDAPNLASGARTVVPCEAAATCQHKSCQAVARVGRFRRATALTGTHGDPRAQAECARAGRRTTSARVRQRRRGARAPWRVANDEICEQGCCDAEAAQPQRDIGWASARRPRDSTRSRRYDIDQRFTDDKNLTALLAQLNAARLARFSRTTAKRLGSYLAQL